MHFNRTSIGVASVLLALGLAGCGRNAGDRIVEEIVERNYQVEPNAKLSVINGDGSIRIYGANTNKLQIEAIKKAYNSKRLAQIAINIVAGPDSVSIETVFPPARKWGLGDRSGTVDYVIIAPQTCAVEKLDVANGEVLVETIRNSVSANLLNGRMFEHNCFGDVHLRVGNGGLDVAYDWWEENTFAVNAEIQDGNLSAFVPSEAAFHLVARAENGQIENDFTEKDERNGDDVSKIDITIGNNPAPQIFLRAQEGNIRVVETDR